MNTTSNQESLVKQVEEKTKELNLLLAECFKSRVSVPINTPIVYDKDGGALYYELKTMPFVQGRVISQN